MKLKATFCSALFVIVLGSMGSSNKKSNLSTAQVSKVIMHTAVVNSANEIGTAAGNNNLWHAPFGGNAGN